jgi:hypothetical protein
MSDQALGRVLQRDQLLLKVVYLQTRRNASCFEKDVRLFAHVVDTRDPIQYTCSKSSK